MLKRYLWVSVCNHYIIVKYHYCGLEKESHTISNEMLSSRGESSSEKEDTQSDTALSQFFHKWLKEKVKGMEFFSVPNRDLRD